MTAFQFVIGTILSTIVILFSSLAIGVVVKIVRNETNCNFFYNEKSK